MVSHNSTHRRRDESARRAGLSLSVLVVHLIGTFVVSKKKKNHEYGQRRMLRSPRNGTHTSPALPLPPFLPSSPPAIPVHLFVKHVPGAVGFLLSFCITITCLFILRSTLKTTSFFFFFSSDKFFFSFNSQLCLQTTRLLLLFPNFRFVHSQL